MTKRELYARGLSRREAVEFHKLLPSDRLAAMLPAEARTAALAAYLKIAGSRRAPSASVKQRARGKPAREGVAAVFGG